MVAGEADPPIDQLATRWQAAACVRRISLSSLLPAGAALIRNLLEALCGSVYSDIVTRKDIDVYVT